MEIKQGNVQFKVSKAATALPPNTPVDNLEIINFLKKTHKLPTAEKVDRLVFEHFRLKRRYMSKRPWDQEGICTTFDLCLDASRQVVEEAAKVDLVVHGTTTSSRYSGSQATEIAHHLGQKCAVFEIKNGCSTSIAALNLAMGLLPQYRTILVTCAETMSHLIHPDAKDDHLSLADGGAALLLEREDQEPTYELLYFTQGSDGAFVDAYTTPGTLPPTLDQLERGSYYTQGDMRVMGEVSGKYYLEMLTALQQHLPLEEVSWFIFHQANWAIIEEMRVRFEIPMEKIIYHCHEVGNIGGASVLYSLADSITQSVFKKGDVCAMVSVGGGINFGLQVWRHL